LINEISYAQPDAGNRRIQSVTQSVIISALVMYALFAPHSIAVTQGVYLLGFLAWGVELLALRKFPQTRTPLDLAFFCFFACCIVSSFFSYEFLVSLKGLKSPAFFFAFYFVSHTIKSLRFAKLLAFALIGSCLINVVYSAGQIAIGRGLRIDSIKAEGAFDREGLEVGDVIIEADDEKVKTLDDLLRIADSNRGRIQIKFQRNEAIGETTVSRKAIRKSGEEGLERLGITTSPGRSFRISGFYSHYETYAEVLQLIAALAVGLFIAYPKKKSLPGLFLGASVLLITATLILTSTRAALVGLSVAVAVMAFASFSKRVLALALLAIILFAPLAYVAIKQTRGNNIFNLQEDSTQYRVEVWREALSLIKDHPLFGIGKGSEGGNRLREKYALYNGGKLPPGHFHSTPIQIATWWGLPALGFYVTLMILFFFKMWKSGQQYRAAKNGDAWGIALGGLGALVAFNISSLAHFNFGDGEVVMLFWLLTGLVFAVRRLETDAVIAPPADNRFAPQAIKDSHKNQPLELEALAESNVRVAAVTQNSKSQ
jgi:hypothetical protein